MFQVWVTTKGDKNCSTNALTFDTVEEAVAYAEDLHSRWMAVMLWFVVPVNAELRGRPSEDEVKEHVVASMDEGIKT